MFTNYTALWIRGTGRFLQHNIQKKTKDKCPVLNDKMAAEKAPTAWSNKKEDYELRDVIGKCLSSDGLGLDLDLQ